MASVVSDVYFSARSALAGSATMARDRQAPIPETTAARLETSSFASEAWDLTANLTDEAFCDTGSACFKEVPTNELTDAEVAREAAMVPNCTREGKEIARETTFAH